MGKAIALVVLAVLLIVGIGTWASYAEFGTQTNVTFTVTGLDDQTSSNSGHKYLVFTTRDAGQKTEVFKDTDALFHGKTDSSDVWARFINAGKGAIWRCPVYGFRIFLFSSYRNILDGCTLLHKGGPGGGDVGTRDPLASNLYPTSNGKAPLTTQLTQTSP